MPPRVVMVKNEILTQLFFRVAVAVIVCLVGICSLNAHQYCTESYISGPLNEEFKVASLKLSLKGPGNQEKYAKNESRTRTSVANNEMLRRRSRT